MADTFTEIGKVYKSQKHGLQRGNSFYYPSENNTNNEKLFQTRKSRKETVVDQIWSLTMRLFLLYLITKEYLVRVCVKASYISKVSWTQQDNTRWSIIPRAHSDYGDKRYS